METLIIYVSTALTHASPEQNAAVVSFKEELRKLPDVEVKDFCPPEPGERQTKLSPKEVYQKDILEGVAVSHLIIAELSEPSSGLGLEVGLAIGKYDLPVLMFAKRSATVSKILIGVPFFHPNVTFMEYDHLLTEMLPGIKSYLQFLRKRLKKAL